MSAHSFHRLYYHFAWSVKDHDPVMVDAFQSFIEKSVRKACEERGIEPLALYMMPDHIHLFVRLLPAAAPATFIGQIKGACSYAFNQHYGNQLVLKWQDGYGVVTVREGEQEKVIRYIENQHEIHANRQASRFLETTEEL